MTDKNIMGEVYGDITAIRYEYFTVDPGTFKGGEQSPSLETEDGSGSYYVCF